MVRIIGALKRFFLFDFFSKEEDPSIAKVVYTLEEPIEEVEIFRLEDQRVILFTKKATALMLCLQDSDAEKTLLRADYNRHFYTEKDKLCLRIHLFDPNIRIFLRYDESHDLLVVALKTSVAKPRVVAALHGPSFTDMIGLKI